MSERLGLSSGRSRWPFLLVAKRIAWEFFGSPLLMYLPRPFHRVNTIILRLFGATIEGRAVVMPGVRVLMPWNLTLGDSCAVGRGVEIYNYDQVSLGKDSVVSQYSFLCTGSHDYTQRTMPLIFKAITVEDGAWVAARAFIGPGVTIGAGAVVGAASVVVRNVEPWTVVAGNPCGVVKRRVLSS